MVKIVQVAILLLLLAVSGSVAQDNPPSLIVDSNPSGARASLLGPFTYSGVTPATFIQPIYGKFNLEVEKPGYETHKSSVYLEPGKTASVSVNLSAKTRFKAGVRSLFIPGWGQIYSDQKGKGYFFMVLTAAAGTAALITHDEFKYRRDLYDETYNRYLEASTIEEKNVIYPELQAKKKDAYDAETERMIAIYAVVGVWGLNMIDALFFFPDFTDNQIVEGISIRPNENLDGAQITVSYSF